MRHVRMLGLFLVALCAIAAIAATSAMALPEWGQCKAQAGGKYSDSGCTEKAKKGTGAYEWHKGTAGVAERKFHGEGGTGILNAALRTPPACEDPFKRSKECEEKYEEEGGTPFALEIECSSESAAGELSSSKDVSNVVVRFHGCTLFGSTPCSNTTVEGEVLVNPLKGTLGYINKGNKEVGVQLTPAKKKGDFAQFVCAGIGTVVGAAGKAGAQEGGPVYKPSGGGDAIISPITPVDVMTTKFTQVYTTNEADENIPNSFEKGKLQVLESYSYSAEEPQISTLWGKAGESVTNVNTSTEEAEIKA